MAFTKATFDYLDSGGLIKWITTAKTSAFTAVSGEGYLVDTSSAAVTVTLPTSPSAGDEIIIVDYASNAGTNNITIDPGTLNLRGATDDLVLSTNNQTARLLYSGATKGWLVTTEAGAGTAAAAAPALTVDYLVVAGGGGGGAGGGFEAGGGAGGLRTSYGSITGGGGGAESSLSLSTATNYTVTVGPGGNPDNNGSDSVFSTITSKGGGYGGNGNGGSGGSGGGSAEQFGTAGAALTSPVVHGYAGGVGHVGNGDWGGGGGGAGEVGSTDSVHHGGDGLEVNIIGGTGNYYAGGGGGSHRSTIYGSVSNGSDGGGGRGASYPAGQTSQNGTANTGGGGGGGVATTGGAIGGSGVVIVRYPDAYTISETTSGGNVLSFTTATDGSDKVTTFTAGANGTIQFSS